MSWVTQIVEWVLPVRFVHVQLSGPHRLWHHTHVLKAVDGDTRMTDRIEYALSFGPSGPIAHVLTVRRDIRNTFAFRRRRIEELMGSMPG